MKKVQWTSINETENGLEQSTNKKSFTLPSSNAINSSKNFNNWTYYLKLNQHWRYAGNHGVIFQHFAAYLFCIFLIQKKYILSFNP